MRADSLLRLLGATVRPSRYTEEASGWADLLQAGLAGGGGGGGVLVVVFLDLPLFAGIASILAALLLMTLTAAYRLQVKVDTRPLLKLDIQTRRNPNSGDFSEYVCLRVSNSRPEVIVERPYARITDFGHLPNGGGWEPDPRIEMRGAINVHRAPTESGDFNTFATFDLAAIDFGHEKMVLAPEPQHTWVRTAVRPGKYGLRVEVGASNLGNKPPSGWFTIGFSHEGNEYETWLGYWMGPEKDKAIRRQPTLDTEGSRLR